LAAVAGGLAAIMMWSGALSNSERLLSRSYRAALSHTDAGTAGSLKVTPAALSDAGEPKPVEALWPGRPGEPSLAFRRPLTVGDRVTISSRDGKPDRLSVIEVDQVDGVAVGAPGVRFQLVTSRLEGAPQGSLVRFLIAVDPAATVPAPAAAKSL
jgi:hypothetical protein